jgi:hypothetical protein
MKTGAAQVILFHEQKLEGRCAPPELRHPSRQNLIQSQLAGSDDSYIRAFFKD